MVEQGFGVVWEGELVESVWAVNSSQNVGDANHFDVDKMHYYTKHIRTRQMRDMLT